jgi:hypothetical protein
MLSCMGLLLDHKLVGACALLAAHGPHCFRCQSTHQRLQVCLCCYGRARLVLYYRTAPSPPEHYSMTLGCDIVPMQAGHLGVSHWPGRLPSVCFEPPKQNVAEHVVAAWGSRLDCPLHFCSCKYGELSILECHSVVTPLGMLPVLGAGVTY